MYDKEKAQKNLAVWINFFKNLSPRIKLVLPEDKGFTPDIWEELAKKEKESGEELDKILLKGWPKHNDIAFLVSCNSAVSLEAKPHFLLKDSFLFCYGNFAFGLTYFEFANDPHPSDEVYTYSLEDYVPDALFWEHINKVIQSRLLELEEEVPPFETK